MPKITHKSTPKIILTNGAVAFLRRNDDYLLMKRSANRRVAPDVWSGVGGHMEREEINDPEVTCLREIFEETGITASQIFDLTLRYLIIRRYGDTIRQSYIYFGQTNADPVITTDEGELYWISEDKLLDRKYTVTFTAMLKHYLTTPDSERIVIGVAENVNGQGHMVWTALEDFEVVVPSEQSVTN
jgi:8-oxo-dGTP diphosphatase